jgi:CelD/BcsL family acetyltransferase involved in cellulose biosynthesis
LLATEVITDAKGLDELREEWDALVVAAATPMAAPAWALAWLRHLAPKDAEARIIAVRDGDTLVGLAPLFLHRDGGAAAYATLGERFLWRVLPLADPERVWEVAQATWSTLVSLDPAPDILRFRSASSGEWYGPWHLAHMASPEQRAPIVRNGDLSPCPFVQIDGTFEEWFAARSANFRSEIRRLRRRFAEAGGTIRISSPATYEQDVATYLRLHMSRWDGRETGFAQHIDVLPRMLLEVVQALPEERVRLYLTELDGETIGAQLFTSAGPVLAYHNGGWDERHSKLKPGLLGVCHALEQAFAAGQRRLDFGPGDYSYKLRFANGDDPVLRSTLFFPGARLAGALATRSPQLASKLGQRVLAQVRARSGKASGNPE